MDAVVETVTPALPEGTVTLFLTDIEGSTKRWESQTGAMREALRKHDEIILRVVAQFGGIDLLKKGEGDSHFAVFESATAALHAGCAVQQALSSEEWGEIDAIRVRVAIHTGEPELHRGDYFGPPVNRCARMRGAAHGGQVILSDATKRLVGSALPEGCHLKDLGLHRFKDLLEPDRIYQLCMPGLDDNFPALNSLSAAKHNIPVQLTSFVGREEILETAKKLLFRNRLITLLGAGGSGKTRVSLQLGAEVLEDYPDGVWVTNLADISDPELVCQAIAGSLPIGLKGRDPLLAILEEFKDARALLVIDNCEHLVSAVSAAVDRILRACPQLTVLATSRQPLRVAGEFVCQVPPMECSLQGVTANIDNVAALEAVRLFRDRAASKLSNQDVLSEDTAADIAAICEKLDGLPLALEQAAANLRYMSPREILKSLNEYSQVLVWDDEGVSDRQKTMDSAIDWSYGRLSEDARRVLAGLSVFSGGWTNDSAAHVCQDLVTGATKTVREVGDLVDRSMVVYERSKERYRMLEPIRQFCAVRLETADEALVRSRHFERFAGIADEAHRAGLDGGNQTHYKTLTAEHDNIVSALGWAIAHKDRAVDALRLCVCMYPFWLRRGLLREGAVFTRRAMDAAPQMPDDLRAEALLILGVLMWQQGSLEAARTATLASLDLWTEAGNLAKVAAAKSNLGGMSFSSGDLDSAVEAFEDAVNIFRELDDPARLPSALSNLGVVEISRAHLDRASDCLREALAMHRKQGNKAAIAKTIDSLMGVFEQQGLLPQNIGLFLEAIDLYREAPDDLTLENLLDQGARHLAAIEDFAMAAQALGAMDVVIERAGREIALPQAQSRGELSDNVQSKLGYAKFRTAYREGRTLGPEVMLGLIYDRLENYEPPI